MVVSFTVPVISKSFASSEKVREKIFSIDVEEKSRPPLETTSKPEAR
jgi:hypothetical protein